MDREELGAAPSLSDKLTDELSQSKYLIVICSQASARSKWVNLEVTEFLDHHGRDKILCVVAPGESEGTFPPALVEGGQLPLAINLNRTADGKARGFEKLAAELLGVSYAELAAREQARRSRQLALVAATSTAGMLLAVALLIYAITQRNEARNQRDVAEFESQTSKEVIDLLVGMFEVANPTTDNPNEISAVTLLARGEEKLSAQLSDRPKVRARLLSTVGRAYFGLGLLDDAQSAQAEVSRSVEPESLSQAINWLELGRIASRQNRLDEALVRLGQAESLIVESYPEELSILGEIYLSQGWVHMLREEAEDVPVELYKSAIDAFDQAYKELHIDHSRSRGSLAMAYVAFGRYSQAEALYKEAIEVHLALQGEDHIIYARHQANLSDLKFQQREAAAALRHAELATKAYLRLVGPDHPDVLISRFGAGRALLELGQYGACEEELSRSLAIAVNVLGEDANMTAEVKAHLARCLAGQGKEREAKQLHEQSMLVYQAVYGDEEASVIDRIHTAILDGYSGLIEKGQRSCSEAVNRIPASQGYSDYYRDLCERHLEGAKAHAA